MEPVITATAINIIISYLEAKAFDKAFDTATEEFTKGSIDWLKSIFFQENGKKKEVLVDLQKAPQDELNQQSAVLAIRKGLREDPKAEQWLQELIEVIESKQASGEHKIMIKNSKNVSTAPINAGGNITIGDNNH